eukprot:8902366-Pyramimonas_sp.AAC.1
MLLRAAPLVAEVVAASFARRGLRLNFAAGKTEVLFQLRGLGTRLAKRELWRDGQGKFEIQSDLLGTFTLHAVRTYPHLGTQLDELGSLGAELAHREDSTRSSANLLRRRIFGAPVDVPREARLHFTGALLFSGLLFNSGTWPHFTDAQHAHMQRVMVNKYRQVLHLPQKDEESVPDRLILAK